MPASSAAASTERMKRGGDIFGAVRRALGRGGFEEVDRASIEGGIVGAWKDPAIPERQYEECTKPEIEAYGRGAAVAPFDALVDILKENVAGLDAKKLLEVGCSSGYYADVLRLKGIGARYSGCDFSGAFVELAKKLHPGVDFRVEDAARLSYPDASFDVVVSGCCILHMLDYEGAIREAARVAGEFVVFHRTPVLHAAKTAYYVKTAYGVRMFEIHFNERELYRLFNASGLYVRDVVTFDAGFTGGRDDKDFGAQKTYLCGKR